ncbi:DUF4349 domain-containing protein [Mycobacterium frederiksbergense]|uniref:DUF4349 domain-containing protein n=1 Tax=Mycolicibacterium frederiksbergense TaxID=117567 RepID=UPI0021F2D723|nr:DUF4349 domain-containing protein [Mycolicibacterium frederiksbergense]MCV7048069.1 DUF4349 domain-containing protein [Mycolicibacterium frederiksbergense]
MIIGWLLRAMAGLVVVFALAACSAGSPPGAPGTAEDFKAGGGSAAETMPLTGPVPQDAPKAPPQVQRDVVKTATISVTADDPPAAADRASALATEAGGRVDGRTEYGGSALDRARITLTLRVPADKLDGVIDGLKGLGTVESLDMQAEDVTSQRVDLDARIKALQTSVDRLLAIMRDARDPSALIEAESALSQRQADLDSLRAQRAALGEQISYSTVTVDLIAPIVGGPAPEEYRGFLGQMERGWDALVDTGSNLLLLVGLLLPWVGAAVVALALLFGLYRVVRARR